MTETRAGQGIDYRGNPVIDPTKNVSELFEAGMKRQDDLREKDAEYLRREMLLRAEYDERLRRAETARIDAIRAVDVGAVNRAAEVQQEAAVTLANQLAATAEASRNQVAATAAAQVTSLAAALEPLQKDIRDLRDAQSRSVGGKDQTVETRASTTGNLGLIIAAAGVMSAFLIGISGIIITLLLRG